MQTKYIETCPPDRLPTPFPVRQLNGFNHLDAKWFRGMRCHLCPPRFLENGNVGITLSLARFFKNTKVLSGRRCKGLLEVRGSGHCEGESPPAPLDKGGAEAARKNPPSPLDKGGAEAARKNPPQPPLIRGEQRPP